MRTEPILYTCPICRESYPTVKEAEACRDVPVDYCGWKIGELLLIPQEAAYPWWAAENKGKIKPWVAFEEPAWPKSRSHFDHQPKTHLWFVVVALRGSNREPHRPTITVYSPYKWGWNPANGDGHCGLYRPGKPDGSTAQSCCFHDPKYKDDPRYKFIMDHMKKAKPPTDKINSLPEVKEMIKSCKDRNFNIHLL